MKKRDIVLIIGVAVAITLAVFSIYHSYTKNKVAYIELQKVFNEFEMTKQYKTKLEAVVNARRAIADSLGLNLKAQSSVLQQVAKKNDKQVEDFIYDKEVYLEKVKQFEEDNVSMKQQYDGEINKQLNQYVKEYGEKNGYRFIYGADGSGVLMYAEQGCNVTEDIIVYINKRYRGEAK